VRSCHVSLVSELGVWSVLGPATGLPAGPNTATSTAPRAAEPVAWMTCSSSAPTGRLSRTSLPLLDEPRRMPSPGTVRLRHALPLRRPRQLRNRVGPRAAPRQNLSRALEAVWGDLLSSQAATTVTPQLPSGGHHVVVARANGRTAGTPVSRTSFAATVIVQPVSTRSSTSRTGPFTENSRSAN
jgi:hypothetical protein